jgi:hypothetical protein
MKYEQTFIAFLDFLGFSEASRELDDVARLRVLDLLLALVQLRAEFSATSSQGAGGTQYYVQPAISTFSDNIVISFNLEALRAAVNTSDSLPEWFLVLPRFADLVAAISAQALRLGLLMRGAATIGRLYRGNGVVFGEALIEAVQLEKRTANYPRVILSSAAAKEFGSKQPFIKRDDDGIYYVDYIRSMIFKSAIPGDRWAANVKQ